MKVYVRGKGEVTLSQKDYVATGGQASVYVKSGTAYKVYTDPKDMVPEPKLRALAAIADNAVIKPQDVLLDPKQRPVGYSMRAVLGSPVALCRLFTRKYREDNGLDHQRVAQLVTDLQGHVDQVHLARAVVVDLNELNVLIPSDHSGSFLIDVDSYQVPGFPATVIMPSVRDWSVGPSGFSELSDWFSVSVLAFQMFIGSHPYKGTHQASASIPKEQRLEHRMRNRISAFRADVVLPQCCYPLDSVPQHYRDWLRAVLEDGKRCHPPDPLSSPVIVVLAAPTAVVQAVALTITELWSDPEGWTIQGYAENASDTLVLSSRGARVKITRNGHPAWPSGAELPGKTLVGFTPRQGTPVAVNLDSGRLRVYDLHRGAEQDLGIAAQALSQSGGRFYAKSGTRILELEFSEGPVKLVAMASRMVADVLEHASALYDGCAVQSMLGAAYVSLFPRAGAGYQVRIPELDRYRVLDAKFEGGVLMVVGAQQGRYDRLTFRFDPEFRESELQSTAQDVQPSGLNFTVLDSGIAVCLAEDERLCAFPAQRGKAGVRTVEDPALGSDMQLTRANGRLAFTRGDRLCQMEMRKP